MKNGMANAAKGLIIAIDGPSGAGKSTVTKLLADRLGYIYVDTGAMFRAVALAAKRACVSVDDEAALIGLCRGIDIAFARDNGCCRVMVNGEDVSEAIRTPEVSLLTSKISAKKPVREFLLHQQREMGKTGGVVLEGRDIGTVVFPDADVKFFLTASAEERARRRHAELQAKGDPQSFEEVLADQLRRDRDDSQRAVAPLRPADDAIAIDTTGTPLAEVVERIVREVGARRGARG